MRNLHSSEHLKYIRHCTENIWKTLATPMCIIVWKYVAIITVTKMLNNVSCYLIMSEKYLTFVERVKTTISVHYLHQTTVSECIHSAKTKLLIIALTWMIESVP